MQVVADCSIHHTEISLVSDWCPNLSFLSRMQAQQEPWAQNSFSPAPAFNPNHTYLAVINSDGDNMQVYTQPAIETDLFNVGMISPALC